MNGLSSLLWIVGAGIVAGLVCGPLILRWVILALAAFGVLPGSSPPSSSARVLAILHPVPWLVFGGLAYGAYRLAANPPGKQWIWFFGATLASIVALYVYSFAMAALIRRRKQEESEHKA